MRVEFDAWFRYNWPTLAFLAALVLGAIYTVGFSDGKSSVIELALQVKDEARNGR